MGILIRIAFSSSLNSRTCIPAKAAESPEPAYVWTHEVLKPEATPEVEKPL